MARLRGAERDVLGILKIHTKRAEAPPFTAAYYNPPPHPSALHSCAQCNLKIYNCKIADFEKTKQFFTSVVNLVPLHSGPKLEKAGQIS